MYFGYQEISIYTYLAIISRTKPMKNLFTNIEKKISKFEFDNSIIYYIALYNLVQG